MLKTGIMVAAAMLVAFSAAATEQRVFTVPFEKDSYDAAASDDILRIVCQYHVSAVEIGLSTGRIVIVGYADKDLDSTDRVELSRRRAIAVADRLFELGAPKETIFVDWKGEIEHPDYPDATGSIDNRRVLISP